MATMSALKLACVLYVTLICVYDEGLFSVYVKELLGSALCL